LELVERVKRLAADRLILILQDPVLKDRVRRVAEEAGLEVLELQGPDRIANEPTPAARGPAAIVLDLEHADAVESIGRFKRLWPTCFVAASIAFPDQERWIAAEAAGCDLVSNRGSLVRQLRKKLRTLQAGEQLVQLKERLIAKKITNAGDGLIGRVPDAPDGVIAIFRLGDRICAIRDVCPHAGFSLADGEFEDGIVTCPEHGSRFEVCSGERVRGPSDYPVQTYQAGFDGDDLYVEV
jgi:nitrite reductase/ring-hydroxylating ferredoxin subunit